MRARSFITVVFLVSSSTVRAQDISVLAIRQPDSGCGLGAAEAVTIRLFNYGSTLPAGTLFQVSYGVDAAPLVSEMVTLGSSFLQNGALDYTFVTTANLSAPGEHALATNVKLAGDVNPQNDGATRTIANDAASVGGAVQAPADPVLDGAVTLVGNSGAIVEWQQSADGLRWRRLANAAAVQPFAQLREDTWFRALVQNGTCPPALSNAAQVTSSDPIFYSGFEP